FTHECFSFPNPYEPHGLKRTAGSQIRGTSARCRRSRVAPPPAPSIPELPSEMERIRRLRIRNHCVYTSEARQGGLRTLAGGGFPTTAAPVHQGHARGLSCPQSTGPPSALRPAAPLAGAAPVHQGHARGLSCPQSPGLPSALRPALRPAAPPAG